MGTGIQRHGGQRGPTEVTARDDRQLCSHCEDSDVGSAMAGTNRSRRLAGKGDSLRRRLGVDLGWCLKGWLVLGFWRVPWTSEQQGLQQSQGSEGAEGRREGGAGRQGAWRRTGWVVRPRPRPEGPLAMWRQRVSRAPVASGEERLPCFSPPPRLSAQAALSRASRRLQGSRGSPRRRSPPLPSAPRVGNARRPLQAWCRWSALGSPRAAPPRGALVRPAKPAGAPTSRAAALRTARVTRTALPGASGRSAAPPCV